jgi:imidazolonepropionase-like amidohydrolase
MLGMFSLTAAPTETLVLNHFTLIDGAGSAPLANAAMEVTDGRIAWVGPSARLKAPAGARTADLTGKFVMPGVINLYGHLAASVDLVQDPKFYTRETVESQLRQYASYGITSVVSLGADKDLIFTLREEQCKSRPRMTRIFTAGRGFSAVGGYPPAPAGTVKAQFEVASPEEVRTDIARLDSQHVDFVKFWYDDHLGTAKKLSFDLAKAIITDASAKGLKTVAHLFYLPDAKALTDAGLNGFAHSVRDLPVDAELISKMKAHNTSVLAATLSRELSTYVFSEPAAMLDDAFFQRAVSPQTLATLKSKAYQEKIAAGMDAKHGCEWLAMAQKNLKTLSDAGIKIGFGTDTGMPGRIQGYFEHLELELMVEAGLRPMQVITDATRNAAEILGVTKDLGVLKQGKWADLLVLGKNPLDNIRNTRTIESVYIAGNKVN